MILQVYFINSIIRLVVKKIITKVAFNIEYSLNKIIIGLLLDDGHIEQRHKKSGNSRFIYAQNSLSILNTY